MEKPKYSISPEAIANGINDLLDEKENLNNIINKLEEWLKDMNIEKLATFDDYDIGQYNAYKKVINKLQELKELKGKEV